MTLIERIHAAWPGAQAPPPRIRFWTYSDGQKTHVVRDRDEAPKQVDLDPHIRLAFPAQWSDLSSAALRSVRGPFSPIERHYLLPRWLVEAVANPTSSVLYGAAQFLDMHLFGPLTPQATGVWVGELTLDQCACIEAVWEATGQLERAPGVLRGQVWRELAPEPVDASGWFEVVYGAQAGVDRLTAVIERAFDGVPAPTGTTLFAAEAADHAGSDDRPGHTGCWQDVSDADLLACQFALPWLDDDGRLFYVPAMMRLVLREVPNVVDGFPVGRQGAHGLWHDPPWLSLRRTAFDEAQQQAIVWFLRVHMGDEAFIAGWEGASSRPPTNP